MFPVQLPRPVHPTFTIAHISPTSGIPSDAPYALAITPLTSPCSATISTAPSSLLTVARTVASFLPTPNTSHSILTVFPAGAGFRNVSERVRETPR